MRLSRSLFAAAVGLFAAGGASAQTAPPPVASPSVVARPAPGPTVPSVPASVTATPIPPGPDAVVYTQGAPAPVHPAPAVTGGKGYYMSGPVTETRLGSGVNGCGSFKQDLSFVFGPCKTFFAPCGGLHTGCFGGKGGFGGGACGRGGCATPVYGTGRHSGFDPCVYDSYLRH